MYTALATDASGSGWTGGGIVDTLSPTTFYEDIDVPSSSFATPTSTSSQIDVRLYPESCTINNYFGNQVSECDHVNVALGQDIYGCTDATAWNYDYSVTIDGIDSSDTTSPCKFCDDNLPSFDVLGATTLVIVPDSAGSSVGSISATLNVQGAGSGITQHSLVVTDSNAVPNIILSLTNAGPVNGAYQTVNLTGLLYGVYNFTFYSGRQHTRHDGSLLQTSCSHTIQVTVPNG